LVASIAIVVAPAPHASATTGAASANAFNPRHFSHPATITNKWVNLIPGTRFVVDGTVDGAPHRIVTTVTDLTKVIDGVRTEVVWDVDYQDGQIAESELAFVAQDDNGAVWNLGEYPEEYEAGKFQGAPNTWIGGLDGAKPGIHMLNDPQVGTSSYTQGRAPAIKFWDKAKVLRTDQRICVPLGCYDDVLVIDEWSPLDPAGGHQLKYYAPHVGGVRIAPVGGTQPEALQLVKLKHLGRHALQEVREEALKLEMRAYQVSKVYRHTPPAKPRS
jgi:hypothetical protein